MTRETGFVKWFNPHRRYGFLGRENKPDLFFGRRSMKFDDKIFIAVGDRMTFEAGVDREGRAVACYCCRRSPLA
jgi:cold shock CspA family protein